MADRQTFEIGLTMAGAVSAGAYTAGVVDFLFEALDAIEDVRAGRPTDYLTAGLAGEKPIIDPPHKVKIRAMSGTSAGSMATAIVATILGTRVPPVTSKRDATDSGPTGNPLYDAWVEDIHYDKLLSTDDIKDKQPVVSLLNSAPLTGIVNKTLGYAKNGDYLRPYVADPIPIYFCVSNLRGVRYSLDLNSGRGIPDAYQMSMHADWVAFNWSKESSPASLSPGPSTTKWKDMGDAALASGAFPIGLSAQSLTRDFNDYVQRKWFDNSSKRRCEFLPLDPRSAFPEGQYTFVNADGGVFNNEPLELCRLELAGEDGRNERAPEKACRAVILIDPFPNLFDLQKDYHNQVKERRALLSVVKSLFGAMISQARFKVDEIALAHDSQVASRYAIMPVRYENNKRADFSIASGSLGGFGGFLSKTFRHHDFMLGRRNCQKFLADHFALPCDPAKGSVNPLFEKWPDDLKRQFKVAPLDDDPPNQPDCLPIIPLLGKLASEEYTRMPPWPVAPFDLRMTELKEAVLARANALKDSLVEQYKPSMALRAGIASYWWLKKKSWVDRFVIETVRKDLETRGINLS